MSNQLRKIWQQNFLVSDSLVRQLVADEVLHDALVIEIGPGKGIITQALAREARRVVAVEIDAYFVDQARKACEDLPNVEVVQGDFLQCTLPQEEFVVFGNVPFGQAVEMMEYALSASPPPIAVGLIVNAYLARSLTGGGVISTSWLPWYEFSVAQEIPPQAFSPVPDAQGAMLWVRQREEVALDWSERKGFGALVKLGYGQGDVVRKNLTKQYERAQVARVCDEVGIGKGVKPGQIGLELWVRLYMKLRN